MYGEDENRGRAFRHIFRMEEANTATTAILYYRMVTKEGTLKS